MVTGSAQRQPRILDDYFYLKYEFLDLIDYDYYIDVYQLDFDFIYEYVKHLNVSLYKFNKYINNDSTLRRHKWLTISRELKVATKILKMWWEQISFTLTVLLPRQLPLKTVLVDC